MEPRIETIQKKKLIGKRLKMTLSNDRTFELWHSFMPHLKEIKNNVSTNLVCMQVYDNTLDFKNFGPDTEFEKWAAVEVSDFNDLPENMYTYTLTGGLYAVFNYIGPANAFHKTFHFIFNTWLPASAYELDNREHFDVMGEKYKNNEPDSEEEVWIPVKIK